MKFKLIKIIGCRTCKELLIFLDRNNQGEDFVRLVAWHTDKEGNTLIQTGELDACKTGIDFKMCERIIDDFSEASAHEFVTSFSM